MAPSSQLTNPMYVAIQALADPICALKCIVLQVPCITFPSSPCFHAPLALVPGSLGAPSMDAAISIRSSIDRRRNPTTISHSSSWANSTAVDWLGVAWGATAKGQRESTT